MILVLAACGLFGSLGYWFVVGLIVVGFSLRGVLGLLVKRVVFSCGLFGCLLI